VGLLVELAVSAGEAEVRGVFSIQFLIVIVIEILIGQWTRLSNLSLER
jgi:hypothetical protein